MGVGLVVVGGVLFDPGQGISPGAKKKAAKPRVKKLVESPGEEKTSLGTWKWRSPIWMKVSELKS
jgi:hypothetical protein